MVVKDRDSYEFYILFHQNKSEFVKYLASKDEHCLEALRNLILNLKVDEDDQKCYLKLIINHLEDTDTITNKVMIKLVECLVLLVDKFPNDPSLKGSNNLKILKVLAKQTNNSLVSSEVSESLVEILFEESSSSHTEVLDILNTLISKQNENSKIILESILKKCTSRFDGLANQNLCYFFEIMCKTRSIEIDANGAFLHKLLIKFFDNENLVKRKQGLFLIKTAIHMKCLETSEEINWMKFILIAEALEQNQSHLIQPTLSSLYQIKFANDHATFMFILCKMIITHDNTVIKNWGLRYVLNETIFSNDNNDDHEKIIIILNQLNSTGLYAEDNDRETDISEDLLNMFIQRNFEVVFSNINKVIWTSVPFFHIITAIHKSIESLAPSLFNRNFIRILENQTAYVGKMLHNTTIRAGVQTIYSEILLLLIQHVELKDLNILMKNIFYMEKSSKALKNIKSCITSLNNECLIYSNDQESLELSKFLFEEQLLSGEYSFNKFIEISSKLPNHDKLVINVLNDVINNNVDFIPHYLKLYQKYLNELESELDQMNLCSEKVLNLLNVLKLDYFQFDDQTKDQFKNIFKKVLLYKSHCDYNAMEMNILTVLSKRSSTYKNNEDIVDAIYCFLNVNLEDRPIQINYQYLKCYIEMIYSFNRRSLNIKQLDTTLFLNNIHVLVECCKHEDLKIVIESLYDFLHRSAIPIDSKQLLFNVINRIFTEILNVNDYNMFHLCFRK